MYSIDFRFAQHGAAKRIRVDWASECHRPPTARRRLWRRHICQNEFSGSSKRRSQPPAITAFTWRSPSTFSLSTPPFSHTSGHPRRSISRFARRGSRKAGARGNANTELHKRAEEMRRERSHLLPAGSCAPREPRRAIASARGLKLSKANKSVGASTKKIIGLHTEPYVYVRYCAHNHFFLCRQSLTNNADQHLQSTHTAKIFFFLFFFNQPTMHWLCVTLSKKCIHHWIFLFCKPPIAIDRDLQV